MSTQDRASDFQVSLSPGQIEELLRKIDPIFDPIPPWMELNKQQLEQFAKVQLEFKIKQLQIQQEKLQSFKELL